MLRIVLPPPGHPIVEVCVRNICPFLTVLCRMMDSWAYTRAVAHPIHVAHSRIPRCEPCTVPACPEQCFRFLRKTPEESDSLQEAYKPVGILAFRVGIITVVHYFRTSLILTFCPVMRERQQQAALLPTYHPTVKRVIFPHPDCSTGNVDGRNLCAEGRLSLLV